MPYTRNLEYRRIANTRISSRMKQVFVLLAVIFIGMLISASVNAISSSEVTEITTVRVQVPTNR